MYAIRSYYELAVGLAAVDQHRLAVGHGEAQLGAKGLFLQRKVGGIEQPVESYNFV